MDCDDLIFYLYQINTLNIKKNVIMIGINLESQLNINKKIY